MRAILTKPLIGILLALVIALIGSLWGFKHYYDLAAERQYTITELRAAAKTSQATIDNLRATRENLEQTYADAEKEAGNIRDEFLALEAELRETSCTPIVRIVKDENAQSESNKITQAISERQYIESTISVLERAYNIHARSYSDQAPNEPDGSMQSGEGRSDNR